MPKKSVHKVEPEFIEAKKPGPKPRYESWMCEKIVEVAAEGGHIPAMMAAINIFSKDTWYRWKIDYPEFKEAIEKAEIVSQAFYEKLGLLGTMGQIKNFSATTYMITMNNKFGDEYKRGTGGNSTEITINQVTLPPEQLAQRIAQKAEQLKMLGVDISTIGVKNDKSK